SVYDARHLPRARPLLPTPEKLETAGPPGNLGSCHCLASGRPVSREERSNLTPERLEVRSVKARTGRHPVKMAGHVRPPAKMTDDVVVVRPDGGNDVTPQLAQRGDDAVVGAVVRHAAIALLERCHLVGGQSPRRVPRTPGREAVEHRKQG